MTVLRQRRRSIRGMLVAVATTSALCALAWGQQGIRSGVGSSPLAGLPAVPEPPDNPTTPAKVELGRLLFFDPRLSVDGTVACATCHQPNRAFTDGRVVAIGVRQLAGTRNTPTLLNTAYNLSQFRDGRARTLEEQALAPIANELEMGSTMPDTVSRLNAIDGYRSRFQAVFGTAVTPENLARAIAAFERTLISGDAPWDRHNLGDIDALSEKAKLGIKIFRHRGRCSLCHIGPTFTDNAFHNLGIGTDTNPPDAGRYEVSREPKDIGAFRTPSLRDIAATAPYMHDGSLKTLEEVVDFYDTGGTANPNLDPRIQARNFTAAEKEALVEFLRALSGKYPVEAAPQLPQ